MIKQANNNHICIFCKNTFNYLEEEHVIPDCISYNPSITISIYDVCKKCNNLFGHTIDNEFLNDNFIKLIRILHRSFIKSKKDPKIVISNFTSANIEGDIVNLDLIIDKKGNRLAISKKPIIKDRILTTFVKESQLPHFISKYGPNLLSLSKLRFKPKIDINLQAILMNKIAPENFYVIFPRYFIKMALEYICYRFGNNIVLHETYDFYREIVNYKADNFYHLCRVAIKVSLPYNPENLQQVTHTIGLKFESSLKKWIFYFYYYNLVQYYVALPADNAFKDCEDCIVNRI